MAGLVGHEVGGTYLKGARLDELFRLAELGGDAGMVGAARVAMRGVFGQLRA